MLELARSCCIISVKQIIKVIALIVLVMSASWVIEKLTGNNAERKSSRHQTPATSSVAARILFPPDRRVNNKALAVQNSPILLQIKTVF